MKKKENKKFDFSSFNYDTKEERVPLTLVILGKILHISIITGVFLLMRYQILGEWFIPIGIIIFIPFISFIISEWNSHPFEPFKLLGLQSLAGLISLIFMAPFIISALVGKLLGYDLQASGVIGGFGLLILVGIFLEIFKGLKKK
jgi:hypothetical protein